MEKRTPQARIADELNQIAAAIERLTGLRSNWNGVVELAPAEARFKGLKPFGCSIVLREDLVSEDIRWRTLIHESFHAVSAGYNQVDYVQNIGWEEGVVEQLQRLLRSRILAEIGVAVDERLFGADEQDSPLNRYIAVLERVRQEFGEEPSDFYVALIATPIKERYASLMQRALRLSGDSRKQAVTTLSAAQPVLLEALHAIRR